MRDVPPDDLPRSPSGRVPEWVRDEVAGRQERPSGWRADRERITADVTSPLGPQPTRRRPRFSWAALGGWAVAAAAVAALVLSLTRGWVDLPFGGANPMTGEARPPAGLEEGPRPRGALAAPAPAPSDGSVRWIDVQPDGSTPLTWSPCRPIHVVVRTTNATADGPGLLRSALDEISRDTGLVFVDDGTTTEDPSPDRSRYQLDRYGDRWAPVLISWVTEAEDPDMTSDVLGLTRPAAIGTPDGTGVFVSGQVEMNADLLASIQKRLGAKATRTVFLHELGHLVGLDHVTDRRSIMYPSYQPKVVTFTPAEMSGLRSLGSGACRGDV